MNQPAGITIFLPWFIVRGRVAAAESLSLGC